ncbi:MAG: hypothetical protein HC819_19735 [Cyclobacteriaceae bacterium]|nr:hypothetical protein [Cyclobacteriaceae bacterium]
MANRYMKNALDSLSIIIVVLLFGCSKSKMPQSPNETKLAIEKYESGELYLIGHKIENQKVGEWRMFRKE